MKIYLKDKIEKNVLKNLMLTLAFLGVSKVPIFLRGVKIVLTLSRPRSILPNTGVRLFGVSIRFNSLSTD
jgi:hypothetical protein